MEKRLGKIRRFFNENKKAKFYFRETTGENCYFKKFFIHKYIGIPKKHSKETMPISKNKGVLII